MPACRARRFSRSGASVGGRTPYVEARQPFRSPTMLKILVIILAAVVLITLAIVSGLFHLIF